MDSSLCLISMQLLSDPTPPMYILEGSACAATSGLGAQILRPGVILLRGGNVTPLVLLFWDFSDRGFSLFPCDWSS